MTVETKLYLDASAKSFTFVRVQDVEPILELNKRQRANPYTSDFGKHVARIPNVIMERWLHEELDRGNVGVRLYSDEFDRIIERKLQDPDWAYLRTDAPATRRGWIGDSA
ncbi:hypothetical protein ACVWWI_003365 [Bradyrhizobium sp. USDA 3686]|uniref:hypothetical protein n=1 Tax=Bradyrhizobium canariense TaxID=255045 RepID=UPI00195ECA81|nr:hypothetical protein [Bradyrhizobium canariense]MBM7483319.1 hypothetical protein [Bradyrhizobium canariense]